MAQGPVFKIMGAVSFPGAGLAWGPTATRSLLQGTMPGSGGSDRFEAARIATPQAIAPIPGDLNPWSDVAKYVGIILPGKFAGPPPAPQKRSYPGLTEHDALTVVGDPPNLEIKPGKSEHFLHTFPASMIHAVDAANPTYGHLSRLPSSWPSAIGETGTVVRIGENLVLTAYHVWKRLEKEFKMGEVDVYVVFDFQDPGESPGTPTGFSGPSTRDDGGWGRPVRKVGIVEGAALVGATNPDGYPLHEDWAILQVAWVTGARIPPWNEESDSEPYEVERMAETDWYNGRRRIATARGAKPESEKFDPDRLVLIGHPLGITKQLADGGSVLLANNNLFQHDLVILTGNSGSPIFRSAIGNTAEIWLVGISLSGRDVRDEPATHHPADDARTPPCPPPLRAHENISLDIREVLRRVREAGGLPGFPRASRLAQATPRIAFTATGGADSAPFLFSTSFPNGAASDASKLEQYFDSAPAQETKAVWAISTQKFDFGDKPVPESFEAALYRSNGTPENLTRIPLTDTFGGTAKTGDIGVLATLKNASGDAVAMAAGFALHESATGGAYAYVVDTDAQSDSVLQSIPATPGYATSNTTALAFMHRRFMAITPSTPLTDARIATKELGISGTNYQKLRTAGIDEQPQPWSGTIPKYHKPTQIEYSVDRGTNWTPIGLEAAETPITATVAYSRGFSITPNTVDCIAPTDALITLDLAAIKQQTTGTTFVSFTSATVTAKADGKSPPTLTVADVFDAPKAKFFSSCVVPAVSKDTKITFKFEIKYKVKKGRTTTNKALTLTLTLTAKPAP